MTPLFEVTIPSRVGIKKNSKRMIFKKGRPRVLSSVNYLNWEKHAAVFIRQAMQKFSGLPIKDYCRAEFVFYFKNHHAEIDISNALQGPEDLLEKLGVIENDRLIQEVFARKVFGHEPKTILRLLPMYPNLRGIAL